MESQSSVDADYGCTYAFGYIGDFAVYGYVQEHLAVIAYDKLRGAPPTAVVLLKAFVGVRALKAFAQCVDGYDTPCFTSGHLHGPVAI